MKEDHKNQTGDITLLSIFIAAAAALNAVEWLIPHPVPWLRLGLANMITLTAIVTMGNRFAFKVALGRVFVSSFVLGTFLSPTFYMGLGGSVVSCLGMILFYRPMGRLSIIGVSVLGAFLHNAAQLILAYMLFVKHPGIVFLLPVIGTGAVISGFINGHLTKKVSQSISSFAKRKLYLVSKSPRRIDILKNAGIPFIIVPPEDVEETPVAREDPVKYALRQAQVKMASSLNKLTPPGIAVSADTVVEIDSSILGKPSGSGDAARMLSMLAGREQKVHTAVAVKNLVTGIQIEEADTTIVKMKQLTREEIDLLKENNLDKAGAYAIQGMGDKYIEYIRGSYTNVVGFPVELLARLLNRVG